VTFPFTAGILIYRLYAKYGNRLIGIVPAGVPVVELMVCVGATGTMFGALRVIVFFSESSS
jgi:hypothetical protein